MNPYNLVFMGTPDFAVPCLKTLAKDPKYNVLAVVTQPDKPAGRGNKLTAPPVKKAAEELGIEVFQPKRLKKIKLNSDGSLEDKKNAELVTKLNQQPIDAYVVVAFGLIIPKSIIDHGKMGVINVHASLLPRWRGAAPLQHAILNGDEHTGVCLMQIDEGLDTGPVFTEEKIPIEADDNLGTVHDKLAELGAESLDEHLADILEGKLKAVAQSEEGATYADKWEKEDCMIDWSGEAAAIERRIRACYPVPGAKAKFDGEQLKVLKAAADTVNNAPGAAGQIVAIEEGGLVVATGKNSHLLIKELQFPGKKPLAVSEVLKGRNISVGDKFE